MNAPCTGMGTPLYALSKDVNVGLHCNRLLPSTMLLKSVFHGPMLFKFRYQPKHCAPAQSCLGRVLPSELAYCEVGIFFHSHSRALLLLLFALLSVDGLLLLEAFFTVHVHTKELHHFYTFLDSLIGLQMLHSIGQLSLHFYWLTLCLHFYWLTIPAFLLANYPCISIGCVCDYCFSPIIIELAK